MASSTALTIIQVFVGVLVAVGAVLLMTVVFQGAEEKSVIKEVRNDWIKDEKSVVQEAAEPNTVQITTRLGKVQGTEEIARDSRVFLAFKGIPFAQPPIGDLRFKDPVPITPWSGVRGGQTPPICPQMDILALIRNEIAVAGQEDCLYLNVYVPKDAPSNLPVMVFIHGGAYFAGDADNVGGTPKFLLTKDIVLVSIQYRLGVLGFLSTEDSVIPGNLGMKDQTLALRWVKENIRDYGGNPDQVTIFGESAGGSSTHLHLFTPYSEGLFQRAIAMSGTALAPFAVRDDHKAVSVRIDKILGCSKEEEESLDSKGLLACLKDIPAEELVLANLKLLKWRFLPMIMTPRVDGDYLPEHPAQLLKEGQTHKVDIIAGVTSHESSYSVLEILQDEAVIKSFMDRFDEVAPLWCGLDNEEDGLNSVKKLFYYYLDTIEMSEDYIEELIKLASDCFFTLSHDESILAHALYASDTNNKVYAYEFEYQSKMYGQRLFNFTIEGDWISHGSDLPFLFNNVMGFEDSTDAKDIFVSEIAVQLWTNFAITGHPTPDLSLGFKWHEMSPDSYHYLGIGPVPSMRNDKRAKRREFWRNLPTKANKILHSEKFA